LSRAVATRSPPDAPFLCAPARLSDRPPAGQRRTGEGPVRLEVTGRTCTGNWELLGERPQLHLADRYESDRQGKAAQQGSHFESSFIALSVTLCSISDSNGHANQPATPSSRRHS